LFFKDSSRSPMTRMSLIGDEDENVFIFPDEDGDEDKDKYEESEMGMKTLVPCKPNHAAI
ncbi:hypothetical protein Tco_0486023, partial [Tanacetum coccineum]